MFRNSGTSLKSFNPILCFERIIFSLFRRAEWNELKRKSKTLNSINFIFITYVDLKHLFNNSKQYYVICASTQHKQVTRHSTILQDILCIDRAYSIDVVIFFYSFQITMAFAALISFKTPRYCVYVDEWIRIDVYVTVCFV